MRRRLPQILWSLGALATLAILYAVVHTLLERSRKATCQENLGKISRAVRMYMEDYDGAYPSQRAWEMRAMGDLPSCPSARSTAHLPDLAPRQRLGVPGYAMNELFGWYHPGGYHPEAVAHPETTVFLFESLVGISHGTRVDPYALLPSRPRSVEDPERRHGGGAFYLFADGHVRWFSAGMVQSASEWGNDGIRPSFDIKQENKSK